MRKRNMRTRRYVNAPLKNGTDKSVPYMVQMKFALI